MHRTTTLLLCFATLALAGQCSAGPPEGLIAHWAFDEGTGTVAADSSGNGNHGAIHGDPQWTTGMVGGALDFDGNEDFIDCGNSAIFDVTDELTLGVWVNLRSVPGDWRAVIAKGDDAWRLATNGATQNMDFAWTGSTRNYMNVASTTALPFNEWHHICCVYSKVDGGRIYVDGRDEAFVADTLGITTGTYPVYIGDNSQITGRLWDGLLDDVQLYDRALSAEEVLMIMKGLTSPGSAADPIPEDQATDVVRDVVLGWTAGEYAATHDVYFGTSFTDVNEAGPADRVDVIIVEEDMPATYDPQGLLEYGQTYYWRVDEVNAPPDSTVFPGAVWSFTVEPFTYPVQNVTATASSSAAAKGMTPDKTVDGSGMDGDEHSMVDTAMWLTASLTSLPAWIQYEFDDVYKLSELWVWNSNQSIESFVGFGAKDVTIEYSLDGTEWTKMADTEFARAPGDAGYIANTTVDMAGVLAKFVRLTIASNWGGIMPQVGLSEVRFYHIPVKARQPSPASGSPGAPLDVTLTWRPGREAVSHEVFFDTDSNAVADGSALVDTVTERSYSPGLLDLGKMYYWKVNEVGDAGTYEGDLWSFTAQEYIPIDDFESYTDNIDAGEAIWQTWIDGLTNLTGSVVGYFEAAKGTFCETAIVHGGGQSMPMDYNNIVSPYYSEAELPLASVQDWTVQGADTLSLWLRGYPISFLETADGITMSAAGADIYNLTDEFRYAYKPLNGDGSITVRVDSVDNLNTWTKAGVMIRESLVAADKSAHMIVTPTGRVEFQYREFGAANTVQPALDEGTVTLPCWVRLTRTGDAFLGEYSTDGTMWQTFTVAAGTSSTTVDMAASVYIGLAVTSHVAGSSATAQFSNVSTSAGISGPWKIAEIGVDHPGNDPGDVYVAVQDSSNNVATVTYPGGANLVDWTEWRIPLSDLAGLNPTKVETLYIGVGDRDNPTPGGAGRVFVDDIGYGRPADGG